MSSILSSAPLVSPFSALDLSTEKTQSKNNNLLQRHALNGILVGGFVDGKGYSDIHTPSLGVSH